LLDEHQHEAIPGSLPIPLAELSQRASELDKKAAYIAYCDTGQRSAAAALLLSERGFRVYVLEGGLLGDSWPVPLSGSASEKLLPIPPAAEQSLSPDPGLSGLELELVRANIDLETALRNKLAATAARRELAEEVARLDRITATGRLPVSQEETIGRLRRQQKELEAQSAAASRALIAAQHRKLEVEIAMREAELEAARLRSRTEAACKALRVQMELHLQKEQERLKKIYLSAAAEIEKLKQDKQEADNRLKSDETKFKAEVSQIQRRLQNEALRIRHGVEAAKRKAAEQIQQMHLQQGAEERRLRTATEMRLRAERERLEEEFVKCVLQIEVARQELDRTQTAKRATEKATLLTIECQTAEEQHRLGIESRLREEREQMEQGSVLAAHTLQEAIKVHEEIEKALAGVQQQIASCVPLGEKSSQQEALEKELKVLDRRLLDAKKQVVAAQQAKQEADQARFALEEKTAKERLLEEELRLHLVQEAEQALEAERVRSEAELEKAQRLIAAMGQMDEKFKEADLQKATEEDLLEDIQAQLAKGGKDIQDVLQEQALAEQMVSLARSALESAATEKEQIRQALKRVKEHIATIKKKQIPPRPGEGS
jgi:hypothetical protein